MPGGGLGWGWLGLAPRTSLHGTDRSNVSISHTAPNGHRADKSSDVLSVGAEHLLSGFLP